MAIFEQWSLLEADFAEFYGVDLELSLLRARTFRWFRTRVTGLFGRSIIAPDGTPVPVARLALALRPPKPRTQQHSARRRR